MGDRTTISIVSAGVSPHVRLGLLRTLREIRNLPERERAK